MTVNPPTSNGNAKQRLSYLLEIYKLYAGHVNTMFNYFLIISGLFVNAYITSLSVTAEINEIVPISIGILGAFLSLIACLIHIRGRDMLDTAERALNIEERNFFEEGAGFVSKVPYRPLYYRHSFQFPLIYGVFVFAFLAMAAYAGEGYLEQLGRASPE